MVHVPVMAEEVGEILDCRPGRVIIDCTLGEGGHAFYLLPKLLPGGKLLGLDRDGEALEAAQARLKDFQGSVRLERANFADLTEVAARWGVGEVDGILFDLGVNSGQLGKAERGFSFQADGPLDMRMDLREQSTATDLVNGLTAFELESIIRRYGEERWAKRISRAVVRERGREAIRSTGRLARVIAQAVPRRGRMHPATRTFQALRIYLNRELESLRKALPAALSLLKPGGRLCVISFHSLEDRIVKNEFRRWGREEGKVAILTKKPLRPTLEEVRRNRRSRSARLRAVERACSASSQITIFKHQATNNTQ